MGPEAVKLMLAIKLRYPNVEAGAMVDPYIAAYDAALNPEAPAFNAALRELLNADVLSREHEFAIQDNARRRAADRGCITILRVTSARRTDQKVRRAGPIPHGYTAPRNECYHKLWRIGLPHTRVHSAQFSFHWRKVAMSALLRPLSKLSSFRSGLRARDLLS